jgi:hypothetical protein
LAFTPEQSPVLPAASEEEDDAEDEEDEAEEASAHKSQPLGYGQNGVSVLLSAIQPKNAHSNEETVSDDDAHASPADPVPKVGSPLIPPVLEHPDSGEFSSPFTIPE